MTPEQFYAQYLPYAQSVSQRTGLDPRLVLAQSALETGYGKSAPNMNFFGIKSHGRKGGSTLSTQEFEGGRMVQQPASFRGYETPEQSFTDYADFITSNPRYKGVLEADGLEAQIAAMAKSGYATDPDYGSKLASIASRFDPNSPKVIAAETMGLLGKGPQTATTGTQGAAPMMQEEKPRGLLGSLGIQKMEEGAAGETGQRFYQRDTFKDTAAILAQGFGRMGIMGMEEIADSVAKQRTESKARNKTAEYLRKAGRTDLADMVDQGLIGGREAASVLMQKPADDRTAMMKNYEFYISKGMSPEQAMAAVQSGTTINMPGAATIGTIPQGYQAVQDPATGSYRLEILPGGPAAVEAERSLEKEGLRGEQATRAAGVVLEDIGRIQDIVSNSTLPVTGAIGSLVKNIPGTNAYDVGALVQTVAGNIGFDRLQQMRDASPTGGALGAINNTELATLQSVLGSLDQSQSQQQFEANLNRLEEIYTEIMRKASAYPNATEFGFPAGGQPAGSDDPLGLRN